MPWARTDDRSNSHAKLLALTDAAYRMWHCGLVYCSANLTDGFIPEHAVHAFGVRARNKEQVAEELCAALAPGKGPLWHVVEGGYQVHDYLEWNDSRDEILTDRAAAAKRKADWRERTQGDETVRRRTRDKTRDGTPDRTQDGTRSGTENQGGTGHDPNARSTYQVPRTTSDPDGRPDPEPREQEPRADARRPQIQVTTTRQVRSHLIAAANAKLDAKPDVDEGELCEAIKQAAADLRTIDCFGRKVTSIANAARGERARRRTA